MSLGGFLRDHLGQMLLHITGMLGLSALLFLTGTSTGVIAIILIAWIVGLTAMLMSGYLLAKKRLNELWAIMEGLPQRYLFAECIPKPNTTAEKQLYLLMRKAGKSMIESVSDARRQQKDYQEYVESWVHEIKAPITAIYLICENDRSDTTRKIQAQLAQIEEQVERSLYYARSEQAESDFVVRKTLLSDVVENTLAKYRTLLIQAGVRVETLNLTMVVYTDDKWLEFILGQLLSNAIQYKSKFPLVSLSGAMEGATPVLSVRDNGIGIAAADLPRIFEKGFTGINGRTIRRATGMGLYLCRKLANHMGTEIAVDSCEGESTQWFCDSLTMNM